MEKIGRNVRIRKLAIRGFLCAGKSTACSVLSSLGTYVVSADKIVHDLLSSDSSCINKVVKLLGAGVLVDGKIDRNKIASEVFSDSTKLDKLEQILHPLVMQELKLRYDQICSSKIYSIFVVEMPTIVFYDFDSWVDVVITIIANEDACKRRFVEKGHSVSEFEDRMKRQRAAEDKLRITDKVIVNNGTKKELKAKLENFLKEELFPSA